MDRDTMERLRDALKNSAVKEFCVKDEKTLICLLYFKVSVSQLAAIDCLREVARDDFPLVEVEKGFDLFVLEDKTIGISFPVPFKTDLKKLGYKQTFLGECKFFIEPDGCFL